MFHVTNPVTERTKNFGIRNAIGDLSPLFAVAFYKCTNGTHLSTYHEVTKLGELQAGRIVNHALLVKELVALVGDNDVDGKGWQDKRILFETRDVVAWHVKARKYPMWFRFNGAQQKLDAHWPHFLFVYGKTNQRLTIYTTLRSDIRKDTKLYHAPICNVSENGYMCQGSASLPTFHGVADDVFLTACEATIYDSFFTHVNHRQTFNANKTDGMEKQVDTSKHFAIWRGLCDENRAPQAKDLAYTGKRVADLFGGV